MNYYLPKTLKELKKIFFYFNKIICKSVEQQQNQNQINEFCDNTHTHTYSTRPDVNQVLQEKLKKRMYILRQEDIRILMHFCIVNAQNCKISSFLIQFQKQRTRGSAHKKIYKFLKKYKQLLKQTTVVGELFLELLKVISNIFLVLFLIIRDVYIHTNNFKFFINFLKLFPRILPNDTNRKGSIDVAKLLDQNMLKKN